MTTTVVLTVQATIEHGDDDYQARLDDLVDQIEELGCSVGVEYEGE